ncbi:TPA: Ig-like domain-containing protein, partial [Photobacterium damselae]
MLFKCFTTHSIALSVATVLAGCGGDDSPTTETTPPSPPPTPSTKLVAMDGFSTVKPDTATVVDLSSFVRSLDAEVVSAEVLGDNSDCGVPIPQGLGLNITAKSGAYCDYRYEARSGNTQSRALLRVLATKASEPMLPPISQTMILGDASLVLNLETLLGSNWPTGYRLNADSIEVQGDEGNLGTVTATGNEITFKGPELSGWNRLVYTISDSAKPGEDKMGAIYVTISQVANQPPHIGSPKYTYTGNVTTAENVVMNLATLQGLNISETNNEDWQLIEVQSFTADVKATNVDSITNKSFSFTAPTVGEHFVSYIIADHYNGYAAGLIKVNVQAK